MDDQQAGRWTWRRKRVWMPAAGLALVGAYALFGFQFAPQLLRTQATEFVRTTYGRELQLGEVRTNPFLLQVELRDLAFPDADGQPMLGFGRLFVDFEVSSLWHRAWVFRELTLDAPLVRAARRADGTVNLAALAPPKPAGAAPAPAAEAAGLPSLWIQSLAVTAGKVGIVDLARREPLRREFTELAFALQDFRTTAEGGGFKLSASTAAGERFDWQGRFALEPAVTSTGEFSLAGLRAAGLGELAGDVLPFVVSAGTLDIAGRYALTAGEALDLKLELPAVQLADLSLRARGVDADWVRLPKLLVSNTTLTLPVQTVAVGRVALTALDVTAWVSPGGAVNLQQLFKPATAAPAVATPASPPSPGKPGRPWQVSLSELSLVDAAVHFEDRLKGPPKAFKLAPLQLQVRNLSLDLGRPLPLTLDARINDGARLQVGGQVTPQPLSASLKVDLAALPLALFQPYVQPVADLSIRTGTAAVQGQLELRPVADAAPTLAFAGELAVDNLRTTDNVLEEDLVTFRRLQVQKLRYTQAPGRLAIDRVVVTDPYLRAIVSPEQVLNISAVLDPAGTAKLLAGRRAAAQAAASETREQKRAREKAEKARAAAAERERKLQARRDAKRGKPAPVAMAALPKETFPVRIREVRIAGGRLNFADLNVRPNFAAEIRKLDGTITGVSTAATDRAQVKLAGQVDEFSPATIEGELQPFAFDRYTDIGLKFENISLPVFNPYSGRFAGYAIEKGKLTTSIHYRIEDRKLTATHKIRIDQLTWGEATAAAGEATLPVKFATVLLRDKDGVINLDLPVNGTLDDPKFRVGPIIWQVVKNILVKAVTAPFALLGSLFGGSEEAQFVDFTPGEAALPEGAEARLKSLATGLVEKPGLSVDVPIGSVAALDGPALVERRFLTLRDAAQRGAVGPKDAAAPLPAFDTLTPAQQVTVLSALLRKLSGSVPKVPEPPPPPEGTPRAEARALRESAAVDFLAGQARAGISIGVPELTALAEERARAVQRALLANPALEPARVFMVRNDKVAPQADRVRFELALK